MGANVQATLDNHIKSGDFWEQEIYLSLKRRSKIAWIIASMAMTTTILSVLALTALVPLKEPVPYVITVDSHTGYLEVAKPLAEGKLSKQQAVTDFLAVRYVKARESYNASILKENYEITQSLSADLAAQEHKELWDGANKDNPSKVFGLGGVVDIHILGVEHLNERTLQVRFTRSLRQDNRITSGNYTAVLTYTYSNAPQTNAERLVNPLGFKVKNYRVSQDIM